MYYIGCCIVFCIVLMCIIVYLVNYFKSVTTDSFSNSVSDSFTYKSVDKSIDKSIDKSVKHPIEELALMFLKKVPGNTIVFDFDDTLADTSNPQRFYFRNGQLVFHYDRIPQIVKLAKSLVVQGYYLILITARPPESLMSTYSNLEEFGIINVKVFTSLYYGQDQSFKAVMRNNINRTSRDKLETLTSEMLYNGDFGFDSENSAENSAENSDGKLKIAMTVGDRYCDVDGQANTLGLKLPDENDSSSYFLYNNKIIHKILPKNNGY